METNVSIMFRNLILPSLDNNNSTSMELTHENKNLKFNYPLLEPLKISFSPKFINDKINLTLSVLEVINKKNKVSFRADLVLNKTIFLEGKTNYEKNLTLIPIDYKDMKKAGKVYIEIKLLDNLEEWKKNMKNNPKKKTTQKYSNSNLNTNKSKEINNIEFDDNISLINLSSNIEDGDLNQINKDLYLDDLVNIDYINHMKNILKNDYQKILQNDINSSIYPSLFI